MRIGIIDVRQAVRDEVIQLGQRLGVEIAPVTKPSHAEELYWNARSDESLILVIGLEEHPEMVLKAARRVLQIAPRCSLIILGSSIDEQSFAQGMALGSKIALPYPFDDEAFSAALRIYAPREMSLLLASQEGESTLHFEAEPTRSATILTVFSPKGGVGTSVLAVNLSCALASFGRKVAIVDGNASFGTIGLLLNLQQPVQSMADLIQEDQTMPQLDSLLDVLQHHSSGVDVLLSPLQPVQAAYITPDFLSSIVQELKKGYDYVVIDTQTSYEDRELRLLDLADRIIVPVAPEITSIHSLRSFIDTALTLLHYSHAKILPVLIRCDTVTPSYIEQSEEVIGRPFVWRVISDGPLVQTSVNSGIPFVLREPEATVSLNVRLLAAHIAEIELPDARGTRTEKRGPRRAFTLFSRMRKQQDQAS